MASVITRNNRFCVIYSYSDKEGVAIRSGKPSRRWEKPIPGKRRLSILSSLAPLRFPNVRQ